MKNLANIMIKSELNQNSIRILSELSSFFSFLFNLITLNLWVEFKSYEKSMNADLNFADHWFSKDNDNLICKVRTA